jgi:L-asparaginase II
MSDRYAGGELIAEVVRSGFVESRHHGSVLVLDASGEVAAWAGDVTAPIFPRSSNKPFQTVGMLRAGLPLTDPGDLAIVSASHYGEPAHIERVRAVLAAGGIPVSALRTPPSYPLADDARDDVVRAGGGPTPLLMNCSGKHAGMLLTCHVNGWPDDDYRVPTHPLQRILHDAIEDLAGEKVAATGVDGCGAPVVALSLRAVARAFLRLVTADPGTAERRVADSMRAHPVLVAGTGAEDTVLMDGIPGLLAKGGADGVQVVALPGVGAVALKIDDGAFRARMPVLVSALRRLGLTGEVLDRYAQTPVLGGGVPVGSVRSAW